MFPALLSLAETVFAVLARASDVGGRLENATAHLVVVRVNHGHGVGVALHQIGEIATKPGTIIDVVRAGDPLDLAPIALGSDALVAAALFRKFALTAGLGHGVRQTGRYDGIQEGSLPVGCSNMVS